MNAKTPSSGTGVAVGLAAAIAIVFGALDLNEKRVLPAYRDIAGVLTICGGITENVREGQIATNAECAEAEYEAVVAHADGIQKCFGEHLGSLSVLEQAAYIDLAYNVGAGAVCKSSIPVKVKRGDREAACATISDFYKSRTPTSGSKRVDCRDPRNRCGGIPKRRAWERSMCERGLPRFGNVVAGVRTTAQWVRGGGTSTAPTAAMPFQFIPLHMKPYAPRARFLRPRTRFV